MTLRNHPFAARFFTFVFLSIAIFVIYSNTYQSSWHLDDRPNIVDNYYLHLDSLQPAKLVKTLFTDPHNPEQLKDRPYRPVACLSFALNWYFGQDDVVGYHLVNTVIHVLTAFVLFLCIIQLFSTPNLKDGSHGNPVFIAFLASALWAAHPIQTQAVTYIVQRMAQFAALFYIIGLYAYLKARLSDNPKQGLCWLALCVGAYLLGVFSKPNAAMMPVALVLMEIAFFQNLSDRRTRKKIVFAALIVTGLIALIGAALYFKGDPLSLLDLYRTRTFTLTERLLAQPRVLLFYLSQLFFPMPDRFSIAHDIVLSASPLKPWTTLPSICLILLLIGFSIKQLGKRPILSFSILFFFLNHVIESSFIPLEIIFEHRNYLPSFFLFLPVAGLFDYLLVKHKKQAINRTSIIILVAALLSFFSISTFVRNQAWRDDITLWMDAVAKAPNNARASNILAIRLAWGNNSSHPNRYDMALKLFEDSLEKHIPSSYVKADIYGNMALIYFHRKANFEKAFECFDEALKIHPENLKIRRDFVEALTINREFEAALEQVNMLISYNPTNGRYLNLKGHILLWMNQYEQALSYFHAASPLVTDKASILLNHAVALSLSGDHGRAEELLLKSIMNYPDDMTYYYAAIENSLKAGEKDKANVYTKKTVSRFGMQNVKNGIAQFADNPRYAPLSAETLSSAVESFHE